MNVKTLLTKISKKDPTWSVLLFNTPRQLDNLVEVFESYNHVCLWGVNSESPADEYMTVSQLISALNQYPSETEVRLFTENNEKFGTDSWINFICENGPAIQINGCNLE